MSISRVDLMEGKALCTQYYVILTSVVIIGHIKVDQTRTAAAETSYQVFGLE